MTDAVASIAALPTSFLLMAIGRYEVDFGRVVFFTRPRLRECIAVQGRARQMIRVASLLSGNQSSFATADLGDCRLEARPDDDAAPGLWAVDVRWFARRPQVLRHGTHPGCTVAFEAAGARVVDVFLTKKPLAGTDEHGHPMFASSPFFERKAEP